VSTGTLRILDAPERRVLLAHVAAHLRHRHHRHRALAGPPPRRPFAALLTAPILVGGLLSVLEAGRDADELFDRAGARDIGVSGTSSPT
jgi:hypothetical protein